MNLPTNAAISLYQLTQKCHKPPQSLFVSAVTFKSLVSNLLDLLIEEKLAATIWMKLPENKNWRQEIEKYQNKGMPESIYACSTRAHSHQLSGTIPIQLTSTPELKKEHFLIALSARFCALILAQQQKKTTQKSIDNLASKQSVLQSQHHNLKMIFTDNAEAIAAVLTGIKQSLVDPDNEQIKAKLESSFPQNSNSEIVTNLLLKQIQITQTDRDKNCLNLVEEKTLTDNINLFTSVEDKFIKTLVRELQSPLTNMKTALRLLESKQIKRNQRQRYLELLNRECDRQNSLINGLLKLTQLDNLLEPTHQSEKLEEIISGIVSTYQPLAKERGIQLGYTITPSLPPVSCPGNWLKQLMLHLLENSLKFTPTAANGRVFVKATVKKDFVEISINDNGVGIDTNDLPKIFDPFFRGRIVSDRGNLGPGLGLTIVRQILDRCDGTIEVISKVGQGSIFSVLLPIAVA
ncbi:MAG: DICT sensory domain-containing protein [Prochloraceae cyanobacterium]|nr:DICT sensory domain-containing protein [Prochloraceae cyanobacterium]